MFFVHTQTAEWSAPLTIANSTDICFLFSVSGLIGTMLPSEGVSQTGEYFNVPVPISSLNTLK